PRTGTAGERPAAHLPDAPCRRSFGGFRRRGAHGRAGGGADRAAAGRAPARHVLVRLACRLIRVGLTVLVASPPLAWAQQPTAWTLPDVLALALRQNPDVVAARLAADSGRPEQGIARALPNPVYSVIPGTPFQQSVAATLDLGPQRIFRTHAAGRGTTATRLVLADVTRQVTFRVRQSFFDVLLADSLRAIALERRDIFRSLLAADSVRWQSGDVPERNVTKSELELAGAEADLARANAQSHAARLTLQTLVG